MSAPNPSRDGIPPPLPPPRHIDDLNKGQDLGWQWANGIRPDPSHPDHLPYGASIDNRVEQLRPITENQRPNNFYSQSLPAHSTGHIPSIERSESRDDDRLPRPNLARLQSETRLSVRTLDSSSRQFDRELLNKLGGGATPSTYPNLSVSLPSPRGPSLDRRSGANLQPLHVPDYKHGGPESPHNRWQGSSPSALSAISAPLRSPLIESQTMSHTQSPRRPRTNQSDNNEEQRAVYGRPGSTTEHNGYIDPELHTESNEGSNINETDREHVDDHISGTRKRRAPSPTYEDPRDHRLPGDQNDLYRRRSHQMPNSRLSPSARVLPHVGTPLTIVSSLAQSHGSHWGTSMASSATSYTSGRFSPGVLSPPADLELPRLPQLSEYHEHPGQGPSDRGQWRGEKWEADGQNALLLSMNAAGLYACECCLKKPRRFRTLQELRHHEAEKQYQCQYCPNRFKNKNEAERHQNSLHLRRNSWSCSALTTGRQAFHPHPVRPESLDICGYCGQEFPNPADWRNRNEHLVNEHKFGECNQQKKFFRADHFRQHLKHSHGAASGKWTAQLENICIKEETPPEPLRSTMEVGPARNMGIAPISSILHDNQSGSSTLPPLPMQTLPPIQQHHQHQPLHQSHQRQSLAQQQQSHPNQHQHQHQQHHQHQ